MANSCMPPPPSTLPQAAPSWEQFTTKQNNCRAKRKFACRTFAVALSRLGLLVVSIASGHFFGNLRPRAPFSSPPFSLCQCAQVILPSSMQMLMMHFLSQRRIAAAANWKWLLQDVCEGERERGGECGSETWSGSGRYMCIERESCSFYVHYLSWNLIEWNGKWRLQVRQFQLRL